MRLDEAIRAAGQCGTVERSVPEWKSDLSAITNEVRRFELCGSSLCFSSADVLADNWSVVPPDPPKPREWYLHFPNGQTHWRSAHVGPRYDCDCGTEPNDRVVRVREVLE